MVEMGKAGGCEKRRRRKGRVGGRASYIDEGRARRLPRDHTVESGGAKPRWGRGGLEHQSKKRRRCPFKLRPESNAWKAALAIAPWQGRRAAGRVATAVPGATWPVRRTPNPDASSTTTIADWYGDAEGRPQSSRCLLKCSRDFIIYMFCCGTSSRSPCLDLALLPIHGHCTLDTGSTMDLNSPHVTRHSRGEILH